jgi:hypothetical protein
MTTTKRSYKKWNINELIRLQREYELLELSIQEISRLHERTERAILCRLEQEGFIENWSEAKGFYEYAILQPELYDYIIHLQNENENKLSKSKSEKSYQYNTSLISFENSINFVKNIVKEMFQKKDSAKETQQVLSFA